MAKYYESHNDCVVRLKDSRIKRLLNDDSNKSAKPISTNFVPIDFNKKNDL